jgi:hypothetical protein
MERTKLAVGDETLDFQFDGKTIKVVTRPADDEQLARLFQLSDSPTWNDSSPMSDDEVAAVVRGLIEQAGRKGEKAEVAGVPPAAALSFPDDSRVFVSPVEPISFSLPGSPSGLILHMDEKGDGHIWALADERVKLGCEGMWWIVDTLIEALEQPVAASRWPRFLTLGSSLGGPAVQASMEAGDLGIGIVWRRLRSGVVEEIVAVQELSYERVDGWLRLLRPIRDDLSRQRVHRQRLKAARQADRWARALERWSN